MKGKKTLIFSLLFFLFACQQKVNNQLINTHQSIQLITGFPARKFAREMVHFNDNGKDYVAFANFSTYKKITVNSIDNKVHFSIPLEGIINREKTKFITFDILNLDTLCLLTKIQNTVYLVDRKGDIIKRKHYKTLNLRGIYLYPPFSLNKNILVAGIQWSPVSDTFTHLEWQHTNNHFFKLFVDSSFNKSKGTISFHLDSLYSRFTKDDEFSIDFNYYNPIDKNRFIFRSSSVDSLYVFDDHYKIDTILKVASKFFPIDHKPISDEYVETHGDKSPYFKHSKITNVIYDNYRKYIYVVVVGQRTNTSPASFSIITYNAHFKKLNEQLIEGREFIPQLFVTSKGVYIRKRKESLSSVTFTLFSYEND